MASLAAHPRLRPGRNRAVSRSSAAAVQRSMPAMRSAAAAPRRVARLGPPQDRRAPARARVPRRRRDQRLRRVPARASPCSPPTSSKAARAHPPPPPDRSPRRTRAAARRAAPASQASRAARFGGPPGEGDLRVARGQPGDLGPDARAAGGRRRPLAPREVAQARRIAGSSANRRSRAAAAAIASSVSRAARCSPRAAKASAVAGAVSPRRRSRHSPARRPRRRPHPALPRQAARLAQQCRPPRPRQRGQPAARALRPGVDQRQQDLRRVAALRRQHRHRRQRLGLVVGEPRRDGGPEPRIGLPGDLFSGSGFRAASPRSRAAEARRREKRGRRPCRQPGCGATPRSIRS